MSAEPNADAAAKAPLSAEARPRVALFVTCLVDLFRPSVGFAAIRLLEQAGCTVEVPPSQTCCGQPAFNTGDRATTEAIARTIVETFEPFDYVVIPSGSCGGMLAKHLPELFEQEPEMRARAAALAGRCHELVSFLVDIRGMRSVGSGFKGRLTYHDSCSGLCELAVKAQPRQLLLIIDGVDLVEKVLKQERAHEALFWRSGGAKAVRKGDWKLVISERTGKTWLYNLADDVSEKRNLSEENPGKVAELENALRDWEREMIDPLWVSNAYSEERFGDDLYIFDM